MAPPKSLKSGRSPRSLGLTLADITELAEQNPSFFSFLLGYRNEKVLTERYLDDPLIVDHGKPGDHDREAKGDRLITYRGRKLRVEAKSLVAELCRTDPETGVIHGRAQIDASGVRWVEMPDGTRHRHAHLLVSDLDLVAVSLYSFGLKDEFAFVAGDRLERTANPRLPERHRKHLLKTGHAISWPLAPPWSSDIFAVLDELVAAGRGSQA